MQNEIELTSQTGVNVFQQILIEKGEEGRPISGVENEIVYIELSEDDERELGFAR